MSTTKARTAATEKRYAEAADRRHDRITPDDSLHPPDLTTDSTGGIWIKPEPTEPLQEQVAQVNRGDWALLSMSSLLASAPEQAGRIATLAAENKRLRDAAQALLDGWQERMAGKSFSEPPEYAALRAALAD